MKKIRNFLMGEARWFTVPRWKIIAIIFVWIIMMLIILTRPLIGGFVVLLYLMFTVYEEKKGMSKEEFVKHTKNALKMIFVMGGMIVSFIIVWMALISPIIFLINSPLFLVEFIPRQFLFAIFFVLAFLMLAPAGAICNFLLKRFMPEKKESEEAEKVKADKGGQ